MDQPKTEVLVVVEHSQGKVAAIAKELLAIGMKLASGLTGRTGALIIGNGIAEMAPEAISYGADSVYLVDSPLLSEYNPDSYTSAITQACQKIAPAIVLLGQTSVARDIAPRIAYRLKSYPYMDSLKLEIDPDSKSLVQTRMVYSGKAEAVIISAGSRPVVATVRSGAMAQLKPDSARSGEIINISVELQSIPTRARLLSTVKAETGEVKLEEAEVVVAGGGGIGGPAGFKLLEQLARVLNGALGTTRVPCDEGWVPSTSYEIGLTGKTVKPRLYLAIGISGAAQHIVGCSESKCIVAVNKDREANIFRVSDFGIVSDYKTFVPALIEKLQSVKR